MWPFGSESGKLGNITIFDSLLNSFENKEVSEKLEQQCEYRKENIIFIGSEMNYDSFWLKMMFMATGFAMGDRGIKLRSSDKNTIAFVDVGYTKAEKLPLELLKIQRGFNINVISSLDDIISYINNRGKETEKILIQDMAFFCHGLVGMLALNYNGFPSIDITVDNLSSIDMGVFLPNGRIYSYACRTGIAKPGKKFNSDEEADPKNSLAQKMADHFKVEVYAFLTRTYYGNVLREESNSEKISSTLKKARQTKDGEIIDIPPEHEGLPHPGLAKGGWLSRTDEEGTDEYALWRKQGAIRMPSAADTPKGLSKSMRCFTPTQ